MFGCVLAFITRDLYNYFIYIFHKQTSNKPILILTHWKIVFLFTQFFIGLRFNYLF